MQNASQLWLGQNHLWRAKDVHRDCRFSVQDSSAQTAKPANYSSSLCKVRNYPPATGLRANLLQGSKRTHCIAVTFSQPQPGPNRSLMGKRLESITYMHTVLPEKLKEGSYLIIALYNLHSS